MKKINIDISKLYTAPEIASLLGVSHVTIFNKIRNGEIPATKAGRVYIVKGDDFFEYVHPSSELTEKKREMINEIVKKVVDEYGEALRKLSKE